MPETTRRRFLRTATLGAAALGLRRAPAARSTRPPNVICLLADDLGWRDTAHFGSRYYQTPHLDRLAARGLTFTDAYAANPLCSPTRASLLTGRDPARLQITVPQGHLPPLETLDYPQRANPWLRVICPPSARHLPPAEVTLGEAFRDAGYRTGFIGKWHLGLNPEHWPEVQGFEEVFHGAPDPGPPSYFSPYRFRAGTVTDGPPGEYLADRAAAEACRFVERHRAEPFCLCFWPWSVHAPFQAKADYIAAHADLKDPLGLQNCPTMAAMIRSLDESVGALLDRLDALGLTDDTIIFFLSDNGGNMYNTVDGTTPTNNAPLRGGKANIYEGGVRTPAILVWPGVVQPGTSTDALFQSPDVYPTLLAAAGLPPRPEQTLDGFDQTPFLRGQAPPPRQTVACHFPHYLDSTGNLPASSLRRGEWKLIRFWDWGPDGRSDTMLGAHRLVRAPAGPCELYNLADDLGETRNLAAERPDLVAELDALLTAHLTRIGAWLPRPNPAYDPRVQHPWFDRPIDGWRASGTCGLRRGAGTLLVTSTGGDPIVLTEEAPEHTGPLRLHLRLACRTAGPGQVFWRTDRHPQFFRDRSVVFPLTHDGQPREVTLDLPIEGKLLGLRLDPGTAEGTVEIDFIRLLTPAGDLLRGWEFAVKEP